MLAFLRFWGVILVMYWSVAIMSLSYRCAPLSESGTRPAALLILLRREHVGHRGQAQYCLHSQIWSVGAVLPRA